MARVGTASFTPATLVVSLMLLGLDATGPYRLSRPGVVLLLLLAALLLEAMKRQGPGLSGLSLAAVGLAIGSPSVGASWCLALYVGLRALVELGFLGDSRQAVANRLSAELPVLAAVAVAQFTPEPWRTAGLAGTYLILMLGLGRPFGLSFRRACEELLWCGLLVLSAPFGPWAALLAVAALLISKAQPDAPEGHLREAFSRQISVSENTLKASHRKFREDAGRFQELLSLQNILDEFQGKALLAGETSALARELVASVGRMEKGCQVAVCRKNGEELQVTAASPGFRLSDYQPLPVGWSTGKMLRASDEERCFYALAGDLFFLLRVPPEAFERLNASLEHLLARARLILRILEQTQDLALLLSEKTAALEQLADSQAALLQSEKLAAIGQLAAGIAHELNSPLAAIQLQTGMARRRLGKNDVDGVLRSLNVCDESSLAAKEIIRSLLAYSRVAGRQRESVRLADLVGQATRMMEGPLRSGEVTLRLQMAELPPLQATGGEIVQILANIISNAVDALRARPGDRRLLITSAATQAGSQQLLLANNGPPIPAEVIERIFDPFFTTKDVGDGTGLGLSIAYQLALAHGGHLQAANRDGWVHFCLTLPTSS